MAAKKTTTIRLDPDLKKEITRIAKERGLTFSQVVALALKSIADGVMFLSVGVSSYPDWFAEEMNKESEETLKLYRERKIKGYTSGKEILRDILDDKAA